MIILYYIVHMVYMEHTILYIKSTAGIAQHYLHSSCKIVLGWKTCNDTIYHSTLVDNFSVVGLPFGFCDVFFCNRIKHPFVQKKNKVA